MIEAKDLRIGNIVMVHEVGYDFSVKPTAKTIKSTSIETVDNIHEEGIDFDYCEGEKDYISIENIEGVPLTEEWLLRAGFYKVNHVHGYSFFAHKKIKIDIYDTKTQWMGYSVKHIKYVHELQNLHYGLYGTEIEFKDGEPSH